ncbi:MAG: translational machinery protein [Bdellovibrionota bacterium]
MAAYVVWIDSREAKVFKLSPEGTQIHHLHTHGKKHHSEPHGKQHATHHHPEWEILFKDVTQSIADAKEVLIMGPGEAKTHLKTHIETHHKHDLAKTIVGMQTVDHPTENQILAESRKFFKSFDTFQGV